MFNTKKLTRNDPFIQKRFAKCLKFVCTVSCPFRDILPFFRISNTRYSFCSNLRAVNPAKSCEKSYFWPTFVCKTRVTRTCFFHFYPFLSASELQRWANVAPSNCPDSMFAVAKDVFSFVEHFVLITLFPVFSSSYSCVIVAKDFLQFLQIANGTKIVSAVLKFVFSCATIPSSVSKPISLLFPWFIELRTAPCCSCKLVSFENYYCCLRNPQNCSYAAFSRVSGLRTLSNSSKAQLGSLQKRICLPESRSNSCISHIAHLNCLQPHSFVFIVISSGQNRLISWKNCDFWV